MKPKGMVKSLTRAYALRLTVVSYFICGDLRKSASYGMSRCVFSEQRFSLASLFTQVYDKWRIYREIEKWVST
jgi:hypothetical protein